MPALTERLDRVCEPSRSASDKERPAVSYRWVPQLTAGSTSSPPSWRGGSACVGACASACQLARERRLTSYARFQPSSRACLGHDFAGVSWDVKQVAHSEWRLRVSYMWRAFSLLLVSGARACLLVLTSDPGELTVTPREWVCCWVSAWWKSSSCVRLSHARLTHGSVRLSPLHTVPRHCR